MPRIVMKFGGTSMAGIERIRSVAERVRREAEAGNQVLVVVSAMAGETDRLVQLCREAARAPRPAANMTWSSRSGEQVTSGLLAMTLQNMGLKARSFMGWQLVRASGVHGNARVEAIECALLDEALSGGTVAVIPGFQGVSADGRVATLGRGGSDTSAVAIAAGVKADRCDIYTDVDGVYTTDPRIVPRARKLHAGHVRGNARARRRSAPRCCRSARSGLRCARTCRLRVLSAFEDKPGTDIVAELSGERNGKQPHRRHRRRPQRGADHADRRARQRRHRRGDHRPLAEAGINGRHDRPRGDPGQRRLRPHLHRSRAPASPRRCRRSSSARARSATTGSSRTTPSPRSASSASASAPTRGSPRRCSRCWPSARSTCSPSRPARSRSAR